MKLKKVHRKMMGRLKEAHRQGGAVNYHGDDVRIIADLYAEGMLNNECFFLRESNVLCTQNRKYPLSEKGDTYFEKNIYKRFREHVIVDIVIDIFAAFGFLTAVYYTLKTAGCWK